MDKSFKTSKITLQISACSLLLFLPAIGVFVAGYPLEKYLQFPPLAQYVIHAGFSQPVFIFVSLLIVFPIAVFLVFPVIYNYKKVEKKSMLTSYDNPQKRRADDAEKRIITLEIPIIIKYKRGRKTIIAPDSELPTNKTPVQEMMLKALARAHSWLELIESGEVTTISQLAEKLNLDKSYVGKIFRLINLAPDIQEAIISGNEPDGLSLGKLRENMPDSWQEQRQLLGIKR